MSHRAATAVAAALALVPCAASAAEWELSVGQRFFHRNLNENIAFAQLRFPTTSSLAESLVAYQGYVVGQIRGRPTDALGLVLGIDTGIIEIDGDRVLGNGKPFGEHFQETLLLGEVEAELQLGETGVVAVRAGKLIADVGRGTVLNGYALGLSADADLSLIDPDLPWRFRAEALFPDATFTSRGKTSPLFHAEIERRFELGLSIAIFGALFIDGRNGLSPLLSDAYFRGRLAELRERAPEARGPIGAAIGAAVGREIQRRYAAGSIGFDVITHGVLGWTGLETKLEGERWRIEANFVLGLGSIRANVVPYPELLETAPNLTRVGVPEAAVEDFVRDQIDELSIRAGMIDFSADFDLADAIGIGGFVVFVSGDQGLGRTDRDASYHGFIGLSPRLDYTSIFFNGGVSTTLASPTAASIAPDGAGLFALGMRWEIRPLDTLRLVPSIAWMTSTRGGELGAGTVYGAETDLRIDWEIADFLAFQLDGGLFWPGSYYGRQPNLARLPVGGQILAGLVLLFDGTATWVTNGG